MWSIMILTFRNVSVVKTRDIDHSFVDGISHPTPALPIWQPGGGAIGTVKGEGQLIVPSLCVCESPGEERAALQGVRGVFRLN